MKRDQLSQALSKVGEFQKVFKQQRKNIPSLKLTYQKLGHPNRNFIFQPSIFRGYVSFREGKGSKNTVVLYRFFLLQSYKLPILGKPFPKTLHEAKGDSENANNATMQMIRFALEEWAVGIRDGTSSSNSATEFAFKET